MDPIWLIAMASVAVTAGALVVDLLQTRSIRKINSRIEAESKTFEERGSIGEQFGGWLLATEKDAEGNEVTNLALCSKVVGHQIAQSFSMGLKGIASGEARTIRSVETKIMEGLKSPESKALMEFCDQIGLPRDLAGTAYDILEKRGLLPQILKNNGLKEGSSSW